MEVKEKAQPQEGTREGEEVEERGKEDAQNLTLCWVGFCEEPGFRVIFFESRKNAGNPGF